MAKGKLKQKNTYSSDTEMGTNYIKIVVILFLILVVFYFITYLITKKPKAEESEPTIQYQEVIAGNILNIKEDEYYVLLEFEGDKYNDLYETYLSIYSSKEDAKSYYLVDMSKGFNQSYISSETNLDSQKVSELKFASTTLLKIKSGKIVEKYYTNETITSALEKIK